MSWIIVNIHIFKDEKQPTYQMNRVAAVRDSIYMLRKLKGEKKPAVILFSRRGVKNLHIQSGHCVQKQQHNLLRCGMSCFNPRGIKEHQITGAKSEPSVNRD